MGVLRLIFLAEKVWKTLPFVVFKIIIA